MNYQELMWEISQCKQNLKATDYKAIKFAEGVLSEEEFAPIRLQREEWRSQINKDEALLPYAKEEWDNREQIEEGE